jgi:hypothetical protein
MKRAKLVMRVLGIVATLFVATGCENSSGSLGKAKVSVLNVVSLEGEGITWDNRAPTPTTQPGR